MTKMTEAQIFEAVLKHIAAPEAWWRNLTGLTPERSGYRVLNAVYGDGADVARETYDNAYYDLRAAARALNDLNDQYRRVDLRDGAPEPGPQPADPWSATADTIVLAVPRQRDEWFPDLHPAGQFQSVVSRPDLNRAIAVLVSQFGDLPVQNNLPDYRVTE